MEMRRRLSEARVATLATVAPDGRPHLVPITFALQEDVVYTAVDHKPKRTQRLQRLANVEANPHAAVLVDRYSDDWTGLWWVRVRGQAHVVADPGERKDAVRALVAKYEPYRDRPPAGPVIAVAAQEWRGWEAKS